MIKKILYLYSYIRLLSIDIVLGVFAGGIYASRLFQTRMPPVFWILLLTSVWIIYITDHLVDGFIAGKNSSEVNFDYHISYRKLFIGLVVLMILINGLLFIFYLENPLKIFGLIAAILVIIYFLAHYLLNKFSIYLMQKEVLIAITYTYGVFGGPIWLASGIKIYQLIVVAGYLSIILANVLIYSVYDFNLDKQLKISSLATVKGIKITRRIAFYTLMISLLLSVIMSLVFHLYLYAFLHVAISTILLMILLNPDKFSQNNLYGIIADAALFLPFLIILKP